MRARAARDYLILIRKESAYRMSITSTITDTADGAHAGRAASMLCSSIVGSAS
jgi:hypothetical protein